MDETSKAFFENLTNTLFLNQKEERAMLLKNQREERKAEREVRESEIEKIIVRGEGQIEKILNTITDNYTKEHKQTRNEIIKRYHSFGILMILTSTLLIGMFSMLLIEPINIQGPLKTLVGMILTVVSGILINTVYKKSQAQYHLEP